MIVMESGDSAGKALALGARGNDALISAKNAEIRPIEPFVVRLAEAVPAESVCLERKSTGLKEIVLFQHPYLGREASPSAAANSMGVFISAYIVEKI
ncbi:MAG TPA: hypothetical protein K8V56_08695 [Sporosarcina psychrophila]|uniref:Uncharacterized protein n=1 Tax=Sporosarcina psychrophila TaxID=1476 RepID=A0A921KEC7_SPOPS|nr:hypothetical protein [Sporosarcina psychrophila]